MVVPRLSGDGPLLVRADDGVELALYRVKRTGGQTDRRTGSAEAAETAARKTPVLLVHGTFSNRHFFLGSEDRGLARYLAGRGHDAWVAELRGHGRSGALGRASSWHFEDWIRRDAPALLAGVREASGAERVVWVGHSAGGVIAVAYAGLGAPDSPTIAGIAMAGAPAPGRPGMVHVPLAALGYGVTRLFGRFPARTLGIGPEDEHPGIMGQWTAWNVRGRWLGADGTDYLANAGRVRIPVLAIAGAADLIAPPQACRRLLDALGGDDRTLLVAGRKQGFAENFTHNRVLVSSPAREQVWPRLAAWIEERFA